MTWAEVRGTRVLVAAVVGAVLLVGPVGETAARWTTPAPIAGGGSLRAGSATLSVTAPYVIELRSAQPAGTRTYASTTRCPLTAGVTECRDVTSTLGLERLVPGDVLHITGTTTLATAGDNLTGTLRLGVADLVNRSTPLGAATAVAVSVAGPVSTTPRTSSDLTWAITPSSGAGTYAVTADLTVPAKNGTSAWGEALRGQTLALSGLTFTFTQT